MNQPRLSLCSADGEVSDDSSSGACSSYEGAVTPPIGGCQTVEIVGPIVVNAGGTGVLHGNVNSYTLNQYIVPATNGETTEWSQNTVQHLVTDAVKLSTDTKKKFFPDDEANILGDKEHLRSLQRKWCCLIAAIIGLSFFTLISILMVSTSTFRNNLPFSSGDKSLELGMEGADMPGAPAMVSRANWLAQPSKGPLDDNTLPANMVVVCHTATETCNTTAACILGVRIIQQFHIESKGWNDISYSYLVGGDNRVYVGRGWDKMGAHTKGFNNGTVGVAFIGTFDTQLPSPEQLDAFNRLIDLGVKLGKLTPDYKLDAQCQLRTTAAPGKAIVKDMASWPHYDTSRPITGCTDY